LCSFYNKFPSNFIKVSMVCFHTTLSQWSRARLKSIKAGVPRSTSIFIHIVKFVMLFFSGIALYKCFQLKVFHAVKSGNLHFFFNVYSLNVYNWWSFHFQLQYTQSTLNRLVLVFEDGEGSDFLKLVIEKYFFTHAVEQTSRRQQEN